MDFQYNNKTKTRRILEELHHEVKTMKEIFEEIFPHDPDKFKVIKRLLGHMEPPKPLSYNELRRLEEKRFYTLIAKLRKEKIVKKRGRGAGALCELTKNGLKKLLKYAEQKQLIKLPKRKYKAKQINSKTLVIFDIPESLKRYRDWIRYQLTDMNFSMLQKSVWIGAYQIPADFVHDLRELNLLQYIHFFKVTQGGSVE